MLTRIDINADTRAELRRVGLAGLGDLEKLDEEAIKSMAEHVLRYPHPNRPAGASVYLSAKAIRNLKTLRYWITLRRRVDGEITPEAFTEDTLYETEARMQEIKDYKRAEKGEDIEKPPKLKSMSKWTSFWEALNTYLGSIRGAAEVPLTYIIRDHGTVPPDAHEQEYDTFDELYHTTTVHEGTHFQADNTRVWHEIKAVIQDGPGWDFIRKFERTKNGRGAVMALKKQNESLNGITTRKNKAYTALSTLRYDGPKKNWTFDQYVAAHLRAHNELEYCKEPVPETKKVKDFLDGIEDERLDSAKDNILGDETKLNDFDETQKYLSLVVSNKKVAAVKRRGRQISASSTGKKPTERKQKNEKGLEISGAKKDTNEEWASLSTEDKRTIQNERAEYNKQRGKRKRKVSFVKKDEEQHEEEDTNQENADETEPSRNAGQQFGRGAHKKKTKV